MSGQYTSLALGRGAMRRAGRACMPAAFVISDIRWASAVDLRCHTRATTVSTCASRTPNGAPSTGHWPPSTPPPHADPPFPKPSVSWWSLTPAPCSGSRSRERGCATQIVAFQTGSAGDWLVPFVRQHLEDAVPVNSSRRPLCRSARMNLAGITLRSPQDETRPPNWGRSMPVASLRGGPWTLTGCGKPWTASKQPQVRTRPPLPTSPWKTGERTPVSHSTHRPRLRHQPNGREASSGRLNGRPE